MQLKREDDARVYGRERRQPQSCVQRDVRVISGVESLQEIFHPYAQVAEDPAGEFLSIEVWHVPGKSSVNDLES